MNGLRAVDVATAVVAFGVAVIVIVDEAFWLRPVWALVFVVFVPGWTMVRVARVPVSSLTLLGAFVLSIVAMTLTSFVLVTRLGWAWRPAAVLWGGACAVMLVQTARRESIESR